MALVKTNGNGVKQHIVTSTNFPMNKKGVYIIELTTVYYHKCCLAQLALI